jgi:hypothetical protein
MLLCEPAYRAAKLECEQHFEKDRSLRTSIKQECFPGVFQIDGRAIQTFPIAYRGGFYGELFTTSWPAVLIKMANGGSVSICNEHAALRMLDGYQGIVPRTFSISTNLPDKCRSEMFALESVGDGDWADIVKIEDRSFYLRMARLIKVIRSLHEFGFVHKDLSERNVRVGLESEDQIYLVDLATVCAWSRRGNCARKLDMFQVTGLVMDVRGSHEWKEEYQVEMIHMEPHGRPNYEYWIDYFRQRASEL